MKEMLGNCSVCSEDKAFDGNPLVYCDGPNCNVAVHKACYGIRVVPKGSWYCSKCVVLKKNPSAKVICELCPSKDGALKPTESGYWAHVVCALFIPEVTFADVDTMEPIKLNEIPLDRYKKICYICEEKNRESKVSGYGACMTCKKSGCKLGFHVTCAQIVGLLCEEAGNHGRNVQYVGYCRHHYSKLKKSSNVKIKHIAPYRPQNSSELSLEEFSQEKLSSNIDSEGHKSKKKYGNFDETKEKVLGNFSVSNQHQIMNNRSNRPKTENISVGRVKQYPNETNLDKTIKSENIDVLMDIDSNNDSQQSDTLKIIEEPNLSIIDTNLTKQPNLPPINLTNSWIKEPNFTNSSSNTSKIAHDQKTFEPIADAPHMLGNALNPNSSMAQQMTDTLNEEIETHKQFNETNESSQRQNFVGPQLHRNIQKSSENSQSGSEWFTNGIGNSAQSLEDLLERQWEQGGSLLMEQAQHFDVASLLSCLYQLKNENIGLEKELANFTRRRDHLLAVNARLAIPLVPQNRTNQVSSTPNHVDTTISPRSNFLSSMDSQVIQQHRYQNYASQSSRYQHHFSSNVSVPSQVIVRGGNDSWEQHNRNQTSMTSPMYQTAISDIQSIPPSRHQINMETLPKHS
ncbi:protein AF-10-like [Daktulosphaira vitifoliae]|uniref:protein AF-10-like n=1 Tax=Daktulosphaira vitifoliae TaxID=58002 RepID=UPI0021A97B37|nr:protein AF-10-like [Daktulosphaira vitifoliae]